MNAQLQTAVNALVDQAVQRITQSIDNAVLGGARMGAPSPRRPADGGPLTEALLSEFDAVLSPTVQQFRSDLRRIAAERLLDRAERLDVSPEALSPLSVPQPAPQSPVSPQPSANGKHPNGELKGGLG